MSKGSALKTAKKINPKKMAWLILMSRKIPYSQATQTKLSGGKTLEHILQEKNMQMFSPLLSDVSGGDRAVAVLCCNC